MTADSSVSKDTSRLAVSGYTTRIRRAVHLRTSSPSWLARAAAAGLTVLSVVFVFSFVVLLEIHGPHTLFTRPLPMQIVLALPGLIVLFTFGTTVGAILGWRNRYWSRIVRIQQTLLSLLGLGFSWQLASLGFLPV
jgi:hypothetical protein